MFIDCIKQCIASKASLPWIDSLPYRMPWKGYNALPILQNVGLFTFYNHPEQAWIQAQMVQVRGLSII